MESGNAESIQFSDDAFEVFVRFMRQMCGYVIRVNMVDYQLLDIEVNVDTGYYELFMQGFTEHEERIPQDGEYVRIPVDGRVLNIHVY